MEVMSTLHVSFLTKLLTVIAKYGTAMAKVFLFFIQLPLGSIFVGEQSICEADKYSFLLLDSIEQHCSTTTNLPLVGVLNHFNFFILWCKLHRMGYIVIYRGSLFSHLKEWSLANSLPSPDNHIICCIGMCLLLRNENQNQWNLVCSLHIIASIYVVWT